jgi:CRP-like cAMP-binding protein
MLSNKKNGNIPSHHEQLSKIILPFTKRFSKRVPAGSYLFRENHSAEYIYLVINGMLKLTKKCLNQSELQISVVNKGNLTGLEAIFPYGYYYSSAIAVTETVVCAVPKDEFLKVFHKYNSSTFVIMNEAYREINEMEERLVNMEERGVISLQAFSRA